MTVYLYNLNDCKLVYNRNICMTAIYPLGTYVTLTIDGVTYYAYKNVDGYVAGLYLTVDTIDTNNNTAAIFIGICPRGMKNVNNDCVDVIYTPIGEFTLGEIYFYGLLAIPVSLFAINRLGDLLFDSMKAKK